MQNLSAYLEVVEEKFGSAFERSSVLPKQVVIFEVYLALFYKNPLHKNSTPIIKLVRSFKKQ